ncbi:MAG: class I SAM-dependent methyltransferase [Anaerolineae bacterium]|nr:class I SAM-dependent methyltransferase [Anaerolineae bacterium]
MRSSSASRYQADLAAEGRAWGAHLAVEASGEWYGWLDHPLVRQHYQDVRRLDGLHWETWARARLGRPAERSLELGCGTGTLSLAVYHAGASSYVEGFDISAARVAEAEQARAVIGAPGRFWTADANTATLEPGRYDLIFSAHSFHHFLALEQIMAQVHQALTPHGLFILEEYVGPTQFQWTSEQLALVEALLASIPTQYRRWRSSPTPTDTAQRGLRRYLRRVYQTLRGRVQPHKTAEPRPRPAQVAAVSPFESIRSAEIVALFEQQFEVVARRPLGGTLQHLLYNGIIHNFDPQDPQARRIIEGIYRVEDSLIQAGLLPSDFMLLVGQQRSA